MEQDWFVDKIAIQSFICELCHCVVLHTAVIEHVDCEQLFCQSCVEQLNSDDCPHCRECMVGRTRSKMSRKIRDAFYLKLVRRCTNKGCTATYALSDMSKHDDECVYGRQLCTHCNESVRLERMDDHCAAECTMFSVPCEVPGCGTLTPRCQIDRHNKKKWRKHQKLLMALVTKGNLARKRYREISVPCYYHMDNETIRQAVTMWRDDRESALRQYGHIYTWDTSGVTDMSLLFTGNKHFSDDLSHWDVSNVTDMDRMFCGVTHYNQPLSTWNVSKVANMSGMFWGASSFNQSLNTWDVSSVTTMRDMFYAASAFNQALSDWNVKSVTVLSGMFQGATAFNQCLNTWDVSNATDMSNMFERAISFNQPLERWNITAVTHVESMFLRAASFHQSLSTWRLDPRVSKRCMFGGIPDFDKTLLKGWKLSRDMFISCPMLVIDSDDDNADDFDEC